MVHYYGLCPGDSVCRVWTGRYLLNFSQAQGWPLPFEVETYAVLGATLLTDLIFFTYCTCPTGT